MSNLRTCMLVLLVSGAVISAVLVNGVRSNRGTERSNVPTMPKQELTSGPNATNSTSRTNEGAFKSDSFKGSKARQGFDVPGSDTPSSKMSKGRKRGDPAHERELLLHLQGSKDWNEQWKILEELHGSRLAEGTAIFRQLVFEGERPIVRALALENYTGSSIANRDQLAAAQVILSAYADEKDGATRGVMLSQLQTISEIDRNAIFVRSVIEDALFHEPNERVRTKAAALVAQRIEDPQGAVRVLESALKTEQSETVRREIEKKIQFLRTYLNAKQSDE